MTTPTSRTKATRRSVTIDGKRRTFTVISAPESVPARDLVLVFHGSKQNGDTHRRFTGSSFDRMAESGSAVVVYLDGFKGNWNDSRRESFFPARLENVDDVEFTRAVIADLEATDGTDSSRVFAVGYSNGGQMVMRLVHEIGPLLAGAAVFSATMPTAEDFNSPPADAGVTGMPILLIHGTKDPIVPFDGGTMAGWAKKVFTVGGSTLSMPATAQYFAGRNGITVQPVARALASASSKTSVEQTDFEQPGRPPVRLLTVHGAGHTIPGPKKAPFILGRTHTGISAAEVVGDYFAIGKR